MNAHRKRKPSGQQDGEDAGEEYAVGDPRTADGSNRSAQFADSIEVQHVGAQQAAHAAGDIGQRGGVPARYQPRDGDGYNRRQQRRNGDADSLTGRAKTWVMAATIATPMAAST